MLPSEPEPVRRVPRAGPPVLLALFWLGSAAPRAVSAAPPPRVLTLERALALARERNTELRRAELQVESAHADRRRALAVILPRLDLAGSVNRARSGGGEVTGSFVDPVTGNTVLLRSPTQTVTAYAASLSLQQLVFDGGKWWNNLAASGLAVDAARENAEEIRLQTTALVERRFYDLVRAQRQLEVLSEAAARSRDQAEATQRLFEAGRQTRADVYGARASQDHDEFARLEQQARVELARQDLALAIGIEIGPSVAAEEPPDLLQVPEAPPAVGDALAQALASRPGLRAFAAAASAQRRAATAAAGDFWPVLSVGASYNRQTWDLGTFTTDLDRASTLVAGVSLSWNLFNGFATRAQVAKAQVQAQQAENDLQGAQQRVASEVEAALAQLAAARQVAAVAAQSEENAREGLRMARARQQVGAGTQLEVRDAELKLTQSQLERVAAGVGGREAEAALRRAMGQP